jgi:hypothetical protein
MPSLAITKKLGKILMDEVVDVPGSSRLMRVMAE